MARKKSFSKEKFEEKIQHELNTSLRRDISDPRLTMVSITKVELSPDHSWVKVYWDTYDASKRGDVKKALEGVSGRFRSLLANALSVRHTPELQFHYDSQYEDEKHITDLLKNTDESAE